MTGRVVLSQGPTSSSVPPPGSLVGTLLRLGVPATDLAALTVGAGTQSASDELATWVLDRPSFAPISVGHILHAPRLPRPAMLLGLAKLAARRLCRRTLDAELRSLRHHGIPAVVIEPGADVTRHMSTDFMSDNASTDIVRSAFLDTGGQIADNVTLRTLQRRVTRWSDIAADGFR